MYLDLVLGPEAKFNKAYPVCREIASWVSELGMLQFEEKLIALQEMLRKWKTGVTYGKVSGPHT